MKILVTGVSGLLGNNLAVFFRKNHDVVGLYHRHSMVVQGVRTFGVDLRDYESVRNSVRKEKPRLVIHCASRTDIDGIEADREGGWQANVLVTRVLLDALRDFDAKVVYISSDSVYPGQRGPYSETMETGPKNWYGATKLEGERLVLSRPDALVLRTNLYGWNIQEKKSLAEWFLESLKRGDRVTGFTDAVFSSIYTLSLARLIEACVEKDLSGIFNCACADSWSKYEFGRRLAERFGFDPERVEPGTLGEHGFQARRGSDLSLDVGRLASALGHPLPTMAESLDDFYRDWSDGLPERIKTADDGNYPSVHWPQFPLIPYGGQIIETEDVNAVVRAVKSSNLTRGPMVEEFEGRLCEIVRCRHAVAVNSGTSALHIACLASGVGPGDEVITSPNTFVASANCAVYCGARPVFADIDPRTYNILPEEIEEKITPQTRAVIPVHFAGQSCDMTAVEAVVRQAEKRFGHRIFIIEDACHALGSRYQGKMVGACAHSDMAVMSFHPVKHITTGEGGCVLTNDDALAKSLGRYRSHGVTSTTAEFVDRQAAFSRDGVGSEENANPWYYEQQWLGFNYRITDLQCALGTSQLRRLDLFRARRRAIVDAYNTAFQGANLIHLPFEAADCDSNFHLYVLLFDFEHMEIDRARLILSLRERGIQTQVHYIPVHTQPYYRQRFGTQTGDCPNAEAYYGKCLSIPLYPAMSERDVERVVAEIRHLAAGR